MVPVRWNSAWFSDVWHSAGELRAFAGTAAPILISEHVAIAPAQPFEVDRLVD
jgi:hypothetical protein